jgi:hypothetical protein
MVVRSKDEGARRSHAAIGLTVKSGWAAAVLLTGLPAPLSVADSRRIELSDPAIPEARQPYHDGFATARSSGPELSRLLGSVRKFGRTSVTKLIQEHNAAGYHLAGVGIVVGSLIDPKDIANEHIRIHAFEGQLFRSVVEEAARECALPYSIWRARDLYGAAVEDLRQPEQHLRSTVSAMRAGVAGSWRSEQKAATVAAWLMLATGRRTSARKPPERAPRATRPRPPRRR